MKTILVVEDDIDIQNLIKNLLEKEHYKVINAYSGTEAMMLIEKENIDLILLDLMLPGLKGERIIAQVKNIPINIVKYDHFNAGFLSILLLKYIQKGWLIIAPIKMQVIRIGIWVVLKWKQYVKRCMPTDVKNAAAISATE